jgi:hypothetical protein
MIRKTIYSFAALIVALSFAAIITAQDKDVSLTGYVIDKACSAGAVKKADPMAAVADHTKKCALMEPCVKSGYGVFADGKYYEFDAKGNELAKSLIDSTSKEKGIKVKVMGKVSGTQLAVTSISETD